LENSSLNIPRTIWWENDAVHLLDQTQLPKKEEILTIRDADALIDAIKRLSVRGAPALGIAGAYGVLLIASGWQHDKAKPRWTELREAVNPLRESRPTAVNLAWAIDRVILAAESQQPSTMESAYSLMQQEAAEIHIEDEERCKKIGMHGAEVLSESANVITHCNAGALATGGIGTALGVIYAAVMQGKQVHVYSDETRPLLQGARLTAWELQRANIPVTVMTDGMAASLMHQRSIDAVVVGADRIN
jgi:methylthioribose-1-phosphate isomerase